MDDGNDLAMGLEGLYQLTPCLDRLRFVYIHANPGPGVGPQAVRVMMRRMLHGFAEAGCSRIVAMDVMNGIGGGHQADEINNQAVINAIEGPDAFSYDTGIQEIYLIYPAG